MKQSLDYLDRIVELINLGAEINIKARLIHLKRLIEEENEQLNKHGVMQGLPIEFVEWLGMHYVKMHGGWVHRYSSQIKPNLKTTTEMYQEYRALKDILNIPTIAQKTGSQTVGHEREKPQD